VTEGYVYKHILIPTDGSAASERAIAAGIALARLLGARVTGFHAAPPAVPLVLGKQLAKAYMSREAIEQAAVRYLGVIGRAAAKAGVACETMHVTSDFPADAILEAARSRKCDLVVMASHGRHGLAAMLLGSETQKVLTHAKIPVLVHR
jgi:nucleotide-binding universal stress UspA family protein